MRNLPKWTLIVVSVVGLMTSGCSSDDGESGDAGTAGDTAGDTTAGGGDDAGDVTGSTTGEICDDQSDEDFVIAFGYRFRLPTESKFDIQLMRPVAKSTLLGLTEFSLKEEGKTCEFGCDFDDKLEWIAVNGAPPDADGFDFQMGKFNDCLEVSLVKGAVLEDKAHFAFAKNFIYYSEKVSCNGPSCQYEIWRQDLDKLNEPPKLLVPFFPPADDDDWKGGHSIFKGRFKVSPDGESMVILSPTIRSQRVYLWTAGALHEVDYLCDNFQNDQCIGAGSQYSDIDPVAISPDSKTVVLYTITDRKLSVRRYSTVNVDDKGQSSLLTVPPNAGGDYRSLACAYRKAWQWTDVIGQPAFTPDGKSLVFIGRADCDPSAEKPETDIIMMDASWIGDVTQTVGEDKLVNLSKNAKGDSPDNHVITGMSLAPDGKRVVFTATPNLSGQWKPIKETDDRHFSDHEVYMMSICGGEATQLTSQVSWEAVTPRALPVPDLEKCPGHPLAQ